jgi:hypothetical protein
VNVLVVGLICIALYIVLMIWWFFFEGEARFTFGREPDPERHRRQREGGAR